MRPLPFHHPAVWRAADKQRDMACRDQDRRGISTGFAVLDQELPDGGWPPNGVVELLCQDAGCGDSDVLAPLLLALSAQCRWQVWINPPWLPYAPALSQQGIGLDHVLLLNCRQDTEILWAMEQCLGGGACSVVQAWPSRLKPQQTRRLQLAAQKGNAIGVLLRPQACGEQASPAPLRLELCAAQHEQFRVRVLKRRGGWGSDWLTLRPVHSLHAKALPPTIRPTGVDPVIPPVQPSKGSASPIPVPVRPFPRSTGHATQGPPGH